MRSAPNQARAAHGTGGAETAGERSGSWSTAEVIKLNPSICYSGPKLGVLIDMAHQDMLLSVRRWADGNDAAEAGRSRISASLHGIRIESAMAFAKQRDKRSCQE